MGNVVSCLKLNLSNSKALALCGKAITRNVITKHDIPIPKKNLCGLQQDALNALVALGISKSVAEQAVNKIILEEPGATQLELIIKKALKAI